MTRTYRQLLFIAIPLFFLFSLGLSTTRSAEAVPAKISGGWHRPVSTKAITKGGGFLDNGCGNGHAIGGKDYYLNDRYHLAVDHPVSRGTPVFAIGDGTVVQNMYNWDGYNNYGIGIEHTTGKGKKIVALYGHVTSSVATGDKVKAGQQIAVVAAYPPGDHLHFGINTGQLPSSGQGSRACSSWARKYGFVAPYWWLSRNPVTAKATPKPKPSPSPVSVSSLQVQDSAAICKNKDGRQELFVIARDGYIHQRWQHSAGGSYSDWHKLVGSPRAKQDIACTNQADGRLSLFWIAPNGDVMTMNQVVVGGRWGNQRRISSTDARDGIAAARQPDGRIIVLWINKADDKVRFATQKSANSNNYKCCWVFSKSKATQDIEAATNSDGRVEALFISENSRLTTLFQTKPNSNEWDCCYSIGSWGSSGIGVELAGNKTLVAHSIDLSGKLYQTKQNKPGGSWNCCTFHGVGASYDVSMGKDHRGRLVSVAIGINHRLYMSWSSDANGGSWSNWRRVS